MAGDDSAHGAREQRAATATRPRPGPPPRRDASMSLLRDLMENTLDAGYAQAAARRRQAEAEGRPAGPGRTSRLVLVVGVALVGLLLATGAHELRARSSRKDHDALVSRVEQATKATDQVAAQVDRLRAQIAAARADTLALTASGRQTSALLDTLEVLAGAVPVQGPGLVVTVDDAKSAGPVDSTGQPRLDNGDDPGRVRDRDLQKVVNGLWAAGAEAIAVNGQRLTATTAIRNAGQAILVDYRPLQPPYVISAIGDPAQLQPRFEDTVGGAYLRLIGQTYGVRFHEETKDGPAALTLPAADGLAVRKASVPTPPRTASPAPSSPAPSSTRRASPAPSRSPSPGATRSPGSTVSGSTASSGGTPGAGH